MKRIFIVKRSTIVLIMSIIMAALLGGSYLYHSGEELSVIQRKELIQKEFSIITTEFKSTTDDGKVLEVYRFDPGTIVVNQGDHVTLKFLGVQGKLHPFEIKGVGVSGEIRKGKETSVTFVAKNKGTYPIVCTAHKDLATGGPMVGYLIVN